MKHIEIALLVERIKNGEPEAFTELYQVMWNSLYYLSCKYVEDSDEAKDVVQEAFIEIFENISNLKDNQAFVAWANKIVWRKSIKAARQQQKRMEMTMDDVADELHEERKEFLPEALLEDEEACRQMLAWIDELPDEQRAVVLLYYHGYLSTAEIAHSLAISPNAVRLKLSRARATLKREIEKVKYQGVGLYSVVGLPVLSRIFLQEANQLCTNEVKDQIWQKIQTGLAASAALAATGGATSATGVTSTGGSTTAGAGTTQVAVWLAVGILVSGVLGGGVWWKLNSGQPNQPLLQGITSQIDSPATTVKEAVETTVPPSGIRTPADMIGKDAADQLMGWHNVTGQRDSETFLTMMQDLGFKELAVWVGLEENSGMYVLYSQEKQDKRLLVCEYHNVYTREWAVRNRLQNSTQDIPEPENLADWFSAN